MRLLASSAGRLLERQVTKRLEEWLSTTEPGLSASFTFFGGSILKCDLLHLRLDDFLFRIAFGVAMPNHPRIKWINGSSIAVDWFCLTAPNLHTILPSQCPKYLAYSSQATWACLCNPFFIKEICRALTFCANYLSHKEKNRFVAWPSAYFSI